MLIQKISAVRREQGVIQWDPDSPGAALRATLNEPGVSTLASVISGQSTLATDSGLVTEPFADGKSALLFPMDFFSALVFTTLEPSLLYRPADGRFYGTVPDLRQTALSRPLAASGPVTGSYQSLKLR